MKLISYVRCVALIGALLLAGCKQQLYTGLSERDANEMIAVLAAKSLQAEKVATEKGDFRIELDRSDFSAAVEALRDNGLPRPKFSSIGEVFKKEGLVTTANAERLRFMFAMSEELSKTLSLIDGVVEARVHPVLPGGDPLTDKLTLASASVFIKHTSDANLTLLAPAIKDLVCASIEGLTYDKVSLTFVPASKMVSQKVQVPINTSVMARLSDGALPSLGIGLAAGLFVLGVGLIWSRRFLRSEDSAEPITQHNELSSRISDVVGYGLFGRVSQLWREFGFSKVLKQQKRKSQDYSHDVQGNTQANAVSHTALQNKTEVVMPMGVTK
jgi:type III secretion protein J